MRITFYISGHGFGHASRVIEVINALFARRPDLSIEARTTAASWLFDRTVRAPAAGAGRFLYQQVECDTGIVQIDSLHLDAEESIRRARAFMADFPARVDAEARHLRAQDAALVVADLPALGIAAGAAAGLPVVAYGNFTWDWIYEAYDGGADVAAVIADAYQRADVALRLPMWGGFDAFDDVIDLPFVARHSRRDPIETRRILGLPLDQRLVLVSFGGYGLERLDLDTLARLEGYGVIVSGARARQGSVLPLDEPAMYAAGVRYEDLVRAVDAVATKPGYGIIAECLANDTALLYTSRGHFREYDVLVAAMPRFLRCAFIDHADLFAGRWQPHLDALLAQPAPPEQPATNGADVGAELLLETLRAQRPRRRRTATKRA